MDDDAVSVYGLTVTGLGAEACAFGADLTAGGESSAPLLHVEQRSISDGRRGARSASLTDSYAEIPLIESSWLSMSRWPVATATFELAEPLNSAELLHPWLVPAAATVSMWHGRKVFHGGLVSDGESAVAVVGSREAGKSSLLAYASTQPGLFVMADDLVVIDGPLVYAGPRSIDLRPASLPHLQNGLLNSRSVRKDTRTRLMVPPAPQSALLVGIVVLNWSDNVRLDPIAPSDRLAALLPQTMIGTLPLGHAGVLDIVRYPTWQLSRPRDWAQMPEALGLLGSILSSAVPQGTLPPLTRKPAALAVPS